MKNFLSIAKTDLLRFISMFALVFFFFWLERWLPVFAQEEALAPLLSSTAIVMAICLVSHFTRRILFPDVDSKLFTRKAMEHPIGAAIVFAAVCMVLSVVISASVTLLR